MAVERFGSKTDVVVKLILVFFISLLSFSIGTFVGKKFSDNQHKLSQLEPVSNDNVSAGDDSTEDRNVASISSNAHEVKPSDALTDEEIAKLAEEFVNDEDSSTTTKKEEKLTDKNSTIHTEAKAEMKRQPTSDEETSKPSTAATKVSEGKVPTHTTKTETTSAPTAAKASLPKEVAASAVGKYTVQVASYPKEEEAQNMANDLKNKGFSSFYIPAQIKGETWYRVSVGLFSTEKEADAYRKDLLTRSKVSSALVQKIAK